MPVITPPPECAHRTARILLEINAAIFNAEKPFIFTSGWASPVYIDCRLLVAHPNSRHAIIDMAKRLINDYAGYENFDYVAGCETAGIAYGAWLSEALRLPMIYIRKEPKGHGRMAQIEGDFPEGARVLMVDDLTTDGKSKIKFVDGLRAAGAVVEHVFTVFQYGIYKDLEANMDALNVSLHALCTWKDVLVAARQAKYFSSQTLDEVEKFLNAPEAWSAAHGGTTRKGAAA